MLNRDGNNITFEQNPMGRFAMPEEIANMAVVLVSGMGKMIVGDVVYMTGGAGVITFDDIAYTLIWKINITQKSVTYKLYFLS